MNPDWTGLVSRIVSGDPKAEDEFCEWFKPWRYFIRQKLRHELVRGADFEDLAQESCMNAIVEIRRGRVRDPMATPDFVKTIVKREICEHVKRAIQDRIGMESWHPIDSIVEESTEFDWKTEQRKYAAMEKAIKMVRMDHQIGLELLLQDGVGYGSVRSDMVGMSPGSYRCRKNRARRALKKAFDQIMKDA